MACPSHPPLRGSWRLDATGQPAPTRGCCPCVDRRCREASLTCARMLRAGGTQSSRGVEQLNHDRTACTVGRGVVPVVLDPWACQGPVGLLPSTPRPASPGEGQPDTPSGVLGLRGRGSCESPRSVGGSAARDPYECTRTPALLCPYASMSALPRVRAYESPPRSGQIINVAAPPSLATLDPLPAPAPLGDPPLVRAPRNSRATRVLALGSSRAIMRTSRYGSPVAAPRSHLPRSRAPRAPALPRSRAPAPALPLPHPHSAPALPHPHSRTRTPAPALPHPHPHPHSRTRAPAPAYPLSRTRTRVPAYLLTRTRALACSRTAYPRTRAPAPAYPRTRVPAPRA